MIEISEDEMRQHGGDMVQDDKMTKRKYVTSFATMAIYVCFPMCTHYTCYNVHII